VLKSHGIFRICLQALQASGNRFYLVVCLILDALFSVSISLFLLCNNNDKYSNFEVKLHVTVGCMRRQCHELKEGDTLKHGRI